MAITIPAFVQYQAPMYPLRALWNSAPPEGDRFISCEIDWGSTTPPATPAVQIALSGNSPLNFSQIVALAVDNARCGSDVQFIFTDSGFVLIVPGYAQGVFPVFTNALMFYVVGTNSVLGDVTAFQILNSMPPPVAMLQTQEQESASAATVDLTANATAPVIPASISGTLNGGTIVANLAGATGSAEAFLRDGAGNILWSGLLTGGDTIVVPLSGLHKRFVNGVNLVIASSGLTAGTASVNLYYTVP